MARLKENSHNALRVPRTPYPQENVSPAFWMFQLCFSRLYIVFKINPLDRKKRAVRSANNGHC
jgi:hypothetical protein